MPATENYPYLTNLRVEKLWKMLLDLDNAFENGSQFALLLAMIITTNKERDACAAFLGVSILAWWSQKSVLLK